jgi:hypothetical protein
MVFMKLAFTNDDGTLKFTSVNQAAAYMAHFKKAASVNSAKKNISDTLAGMGTGGDHQGRTKVFNRNTAYGYSIEKLK